MKPLDYIIDQRNEQNNAIRLNMIFIFITSKQIKNDTKMSLGHLWENLIAFSCNTRFTNKVIQLRKFKD